MRKLFSLLLALAATTSLWAHDFEVNGIYYNYLDDNNVEVTYGGGYSYSGEVTIPATVTYNGTTYSVTSIGEAAFAGCSSLTSVTIGNSVTSIGNDAFGWCSFLISITIPNSVTSIGGSAFYNTGIYNDESNWENDVLYIDNCLINAKTSISGAYTIKENTRLIADFAFFGFSSLTSITIPNSVTSIGGYAFAVCSSLTSITCIGNTPPETYTLGVDTSTCTLIVPLPAYNAYLSHAYWGQFLNIVPSSELGSSAPEVYSNPANPTQKLLLDGKIYILRDGKTYTAMGAEIQ